MLPPIQVLQDNKSILESFFLGIHNDFREHRDDEKTLSDITHTLDSMLSGIKVKYGNPSQNREPECTCEALAQQSSRGGL